MDESHSVNRILIARPIVQKWKEFTRTIFPKSPLSVLITHAHHAFPQIRHHLL
ncbi:hypothetical protein PAXRUDRAFT_460170 [Paxillus rubicundulus Ve08.2h10]|uniref:Uncharacterized protein n=1 Tax=Paxillus rubicundulus Ve08.2h10 TaxID=930991 RepID=A0A0D0E7Q7_9AGAM|nr:hypothetical protein PAXRUDRAFT_460170 [Paxillus rubicundulus Ve08.2h10]